MKKEKTGGKKAGKILKRIGIVIGGIILALCLLLLAAYTEPMFDGSSIKSDTVAGSENWMAALPDDELISEVALPGTHDSATEYVQLSFFSKCQALSIGEQLEAGYRYLDIRLGVATAEDGEQSLMLMHGFTHCKTGNGPAADDLYLDSVLNQAYEFLDENPTEGIVFVVKQEYGDESLTEFQTLLNSYIEKNPEYWCLTDTVPTVGQMRGKILLCRRYADEAAYGDQAGLSMVWIDQEGSDDPTAGVGTFEEDSYLLAVQDRYEYKASDKWNAYLATLDYGQNEHEEGDVVLNFMSTKGTLVYGHPHYFAKTMNKHLESFDFSGMDFFGWTIMDFGSPELAQIIYQLNFE